MCSVGSDELGLPCLRGLATACEANGGKNRGLMTRAWWTGSGLLKAVASPAPGRCTGQRRNAAKPGAAGLMCSSGKAEAGKQGMLGMCVRRGGDGRAGIVTNVVIYKTLPRRKRRVVVVRATEYRYVPNKSTCRHGIPAIIIPSALEDHFRRQRDAIYLWLKS